MLIFQVDTMDIRMVWNMGSITPTISWGCVTKTVNSDCRIVYTSISKLAIQMGNIESTNGYTLW